MSVFWRGYVAGALSIFLVVASCQPFPCRAGALPVGFYVVCR